jgi:antitoxin FitA
MPKTVQIRDIDDDVYQALAARAADVGLTVPEMLRREVTRLASRPTVEQWLARTRRRPSQVSRQEIVETLDDLRGEWPRAGR